MQGKFKRAPIGEVYVGAEVTNKVDLGIITRSLAKAAIKFCGTLVSDLHSSFGDDPETSNYEMPHLVSPLFPTFDKIVVSAPNETPPTMGYPFPETIEQRRARQKLGKIADCKIDVNNTYSFSVNTSQVDLLNWKLVGIPMVRPIELSTFFGSSMIRFGMWV